MCTQIVTIDNRVAGLLEPVATRNPDRSITLDWQGDEKLQCLASHKLIQGMVDAHNEMVAVRAFLAPNEGQTLRDRLAELHDLLCRVAAPMDDEWVNWDDLQTAITLAERLTDEAEAVTP